MLKKVKLYSLLAIIVASTVVGVFGPQTAFADQYDATGFDDRRVLEDANVVTYTRLISFCLEQMSSTRVGNNYSATQTDLVNGDWFKNIPSDADFYKQSVGYATEHHGGDGIISCNDDNVKIGKHFTSIGGWGAGNEIAAACDVSFRMEGRGGSSGGIFGGGTERDTPQQCKNISSDNQDASYRAQMRDERGDENGDSSLLQLLPRGENTTGGYGYNPVQMYLLYKVALEGPCRATSHGLVAGNTSSNAGNYTEVTLVNMAGEPNSVYYDIPNGGDNVPIAYGISANCDELPGLMQDTSRAYGLWLGSSNPTDTDHVGQNIWIGSGDSPSSCNIGHGIGWMLCPISNFIAEVVDYVYDLLQTFLTTPALSTDRESGTYKAWSMFRNYANVIFVILFLIIIYAQITGGGISNYAMKKILPRIIVGAILVNTSYWICAVAVDATNLLGSSLQDLLMGARSTVVGNATEIPTWSVITTGILGGSLAGIAAVSAYAGAGTVVGALVAPLSILLATAFFSLITAFLVLAARQALIVILIVLAPLAFAAYLLPNTQKWFDRWRTLFMALLIMYPILSVVFGGSQLAASIIMNSASNMPMVLLAMGVQVIPLAMTPFIIKLSGGLLERFAGIVNNSEKGPIDRVRKWSDEQKGYGRRGALGAESPSFGQGILQRRENVRRKREERAKTADTAAGTYYDEYAAGDTDILGYRRRSKELEARTQRATDTSATDVANAMAGSAASQNILALAENAKFERKAAEDRLGEAVAPLVDTVSRIGAAEAETNKQATEDAIEAGVRRGMSGGVVARLEEAKLDRQAAQDDLDRRASLKVDQDVRTSAAEAALNKQAIQDHIDSRTQDDTSRTVMARAERAKLAKQTAENEAARDTAPMVSEAARTAAMASELQKQTAENRAEAGAISGISNSAVKQAEQAKREKQAAEDRSASIGLESLTRSAAGRDALRDAQEASLRKQVAEAKISAHEAEQINTDPALRSYDVGKRTNDLRAKTSQSEADASWSGKTLEDPELKNLTMEQQKNQTAASMAQGVAARRFNKEMAEGTVSPANALGVTSPGTVTEVEKAAAAAKTEAGEKEVRREQQALQEKLATMDIKDRDAHLINTAKSSDSYEFASAVNEAARLGRDGALRTIQDDIRTGGGTPDEIRNKLATIQEAMGDNANTLLPKAPHFIKGTSAFDDMDAGQLSTISADTAKEYMEYMEGLVADALATGDMAKKEKADMVLHRFVGAMKANHSNPAGKIKGDAGTAILRSVSGMSGAAAVYMTTEISSGLAHIDPSTGQIIK